MADIDLGEEIIDEFEDNERQTRAKKELRIKTEIYNEGALFYDFYVNPDIVKIIDDLKNINFIKKGGKLDKIATEVINNKGKYHIGKRKTFLINLSRMIYNFVKKVDPFIFNNVNNYIDIFKFYDKYKDEPGTFIYWTKNFIKDYDDYQKNLINPKILASPNYTPLFDIETMRALAGDTKAKDDYDKIIEERAIDIANKSLIEDENKAKALNDFLLKGGEIGTDEFQNILDKIYGVGYVYLDEKKQPKLTKDERDTQKELRDKFLKQLRDLNKKKLEQFLLDYEAKKEGLTGVGVVPTSTNKKILSAVMSNLNNIETVKAEKVKNNSNTQMIFTYPFGFPKSEIKLEEASFNVYQGDKKPKKFGIRYDLAKKWCLEGGYYNKELKAQTQLNRLQSEDTIYRNRKYQWKINN